jgi:hypothetical protein
MLAQLKNNKLTNIIAMSFFIVFFLYYFNSEKLYKKLEFESFRTPCDGDAIRSHAGGNSLYDL